MSCIYAIPEYDNVFYFVFFSVFSHKNITEELHSTFIMNERKRILLTTDDILWRKFITHIIHQQGRRSWGGSSANWSVCNFDFERRGLEWGCRRREHDRTDQISRYSRQLLLLDGFGVLGQRKLLSSSVLVVRAGGIGSSLLLFLAVSGVGRIMVVVHDNVEVSNLHWQYQSIYNLTKHVWVVTPILNWNQISIYRRL